MEVKVNDQVTYRKQLRNRTTLIETGTVLTIDGKKAVVSFASPMGSNIRIRREVSVDSLEPVSSRFGGRALVHPDPLKRFGS